MNCPVCGTKVDDGNKFCTFCGARLAAQKTEPAPELVLEGAEENAAVPPVDSTPELVLEPSMEDAVEMAAMDALEALNEAAMDPFAGAVPVAPDPVYKNPVQAEYQPKTEPVKPAQTQSAGAYQQAQQPHQPAGGYQQAQQPYQPTGGYQQAQQPYRPAGGYQQAQQPYQPAGGYQQTQQSYQPAGGYQQGHQPYQGAPVKPVIPGHGTAVASLICGIASLVMIFCSAGLLGVPCAVAGLITASISKNHGNTEGIRTGGFVTSLIGLILNILTVIACVACIGILAEM